MVVDFVLCCVVMRAEEVGLGKLFPFLFYICFSFSASAAYLFENLSSSSASSSNSFYTTRTISIFFFISFFFFYLIYVDLP